MKVHGTDRRDHWISRLIKAVGVLGFLEQYHEDQADCQGVGHVGQKIDGLVTGLSKDVMELKPREIKSARPSGDRNRDDHQEEGVFHRLEKIRCHAAHRNSCKVPVPK